VLEGRGEQPDAASVDFEDAGGTLPVTSGLPGPAGSGGSLTAGSGAAAGGAAAGGGLPGGGGDVPDADASVVDAEVAPQCPLEGTFALEFRLHVRWAAKNFADLVPVVDAGDGEVSFILLAKFNRTQQGAQVVGQICDTSVPDFYSGLVDEWYATYFPPDMWDSPTMPHFSFSFTSSCREPGPNCTLQSGQIHAPLGVDLPDISGQFPSSKAMGVWPDHDGDGEPGVTAYMLGPDEHTSSGRPYSYPPVNPVLLRRVNKVMLGLRMRLLLNATWPSCDMLQGKIPESSVDSRALGCSADSDPVECRDIELEFLDSNLPTWAVRDGIFQGVRMEAGVDCSASRARLR
jgi:hypothetical protein